MPTPSRANVEAARAAVLARLCQAGAGTVTHYASVADDVEAARGLTPQRARHALRAAVNGLADEGKVEPWGRRLRDGRWAVAWLRAPGRMGLPPAPKPRTKWRAKGPPPKGQFHVAPGLMGLVERAILDLLADSPGEVEHLLAASFSPPPAPGWVSYAWLANRVGVRLQGRLNPRTKWNVVGCAVRSLARRGEVSLRARPTRDGKSKVRWARLEPGGAPR